MRLAIMEVQAVAWIAAATMTEAWGMAALWAVILIFELKRRHAYQNADDGNA